MKNSFLILYIVLFTNLAFSQDKILVVYADASVISNQFSFRNKLINAIQDSEHKLILFVSNGNKPFVTTNIYDTQQLLDRVEKLNPPMPNVILDLDSLNELFGNDSILSDVSIRATDIQESINFYFFFNANQCRMLKQDQRIARAFLLSNRLITKKGLMPSCKAKLFIQNISSAEDSAYFKKIKQEGLFEIDPY